MRILAVDDEPLALGGLVEEINKARKGCDIVSDIDPIAALDKLGKAGFRMWYSWILRCRGSTAWRWRSV